MFNKILIANRGEIACRVMRTARNMGIATVAVYSEADRHALHVQSADEAYAIGAAPPRQSYLSIDNIIVAAHASGADAIHPGYGFLSENADFADACAAAHIVFIGPPAAAMRAMGSKAAAKALMAHAGVPLVPGYHDAAQDFATLQVAAAQIGYPVLIKASAGGGGKGMRVVTAAADLEPAIDGARREAASSFGDDRLLIERYLTQPRHIEIQVFADTRGNCVSLFERDCSIQRRHQKVIEEAPAPFMRAQRREAMGQAAVAAARAVGYVGAGTVEFIAEAGDFFFMEMNTRLQVEHPVSEMITGVELVEWQFRVAAGEALPLLQDDLHITGHAMEARIYAEDPARDFLPSIGTLTHLRQPEAGPGVRIDTGVREGDAITSFYDPMIAKLIVWGSDRADARRRLCRALDAYEIVGVHTNLALLRGIAAHPDFAAGGVDTGFIARHPDLLAPPASAAADPHILAAASLAVLAAQAIHQAPVPNDPWSPWDLRDSWRMNGEGFQDLHFTSGDMDYAVRAHSLAGAAGYRLDLPGGAVLVRAEERAGGLRLTVDGVARDVSVVMRGAAVTVVGPRGNTIFQLHDRLAPPRSEAAAEGRLTAPIPARVARIAVSQGEKVARGATLLVLEAMKMELTISAPFDGTIEQIFHAAGDMVEEGAPLIALNDAVSSADAEPGT